MAWYSGERIVGIVIFSIVSAIIVYSYYTMVVIMIFKSLLLSKNLGLVILGIIFLVIYHILVILTATSYYRTVFSNPGYVEESKAKENAIIAPNQYEEPDPHATTYCSKCNANKPPRAHHCKICGKCILKMDHHCVWVNNCVGWNNYKYFILLLNYTVVTCFTIILMIVIYFCIVGVKDINANNVQLLFTGIIAFSISMSACFLGCYHWKLLCRNKTTLEDFGDRNPFDLGTKMDNIKFVCGNNKLLWFFPIFTTDETGYSYPKLTLL